MDSKMSILYQTDRGFGGLLAGIIGSRIVSPYNVLFEPRPLVADGGQVRPHLTAMTLES